MTRQSARLGFTLVEILIIAPVVILVIASFVVFIVNITGEVLKTRASLEALGDTQSGLNYIQSDIKLSSGFLGAVVSPQPPQGSDDGTADWSNSGSLTTNQSFILARLATTTNPVSSSDASFVYTSATPNPCGATETENTAYTYYSVYYLKNGSLWQRNILPGYPGNALCETPWQLPTCTTASESFPVCKADDVEVAKNVTTFTVQYFDSAGAATSTRGAAASAEVSISTKKTVAGQDVVAVNKLRTPKRTGSLDPNSQTGDPYDLASSFAYAAPTTPFFSWDAITGASSYDVRYKVNGGAWSSYVNTGSSSPNYTYNVTEVFRNETVSIQVRAKNGSTILSTSSAVTATVPAWTACQYQNGWISYHETWAGAEFTKTSAGVVMMRGLIKYPGTSPVTPPSGSIVCNLPAGFRPDGGAMIFFTATASTTAGRMNVATNGDLTYYSIGRGEWQSLSSIIFATGSTGWQAATPTNSWVDYANGYSPVKYKPDGVGRIHVQGLAKSGTINNYGYTLGTSSNGQNAYDIYPSYNCNTTGTLQYEATAKIYARISANGCWSVQAMFYPTTGYTGGGAWQAAALASPWANYGTYNNAGYIKSSDGIVSLRGLIKTGTSGTIFTLPATYRPSKTVLCYVASAGEAYARIDVNTTGLVVANESSGTNSSWLSLAGCNFMAEQ